MQKLMIYDDNPHIGGYSNGDRFWLLDDEPHREGGPAIEWGDGYKGCYLNNKFHKE